jgi:hypothetical protein
VVRAFCLLETARVEFDYPNSTPGSVSQLNSEQLLDWLAELGTRLEHLQRFLATCVAHNHQAAKALELQQAVGKLARSWRGGCL